MRGGGLARDKDKALLAHLHVADVGVLVVHGHLALLVQGFLL